MLLDELIRGHTRRDLPINMLSPKTRVAVRDMADALRRNAGGRWFTDNRPFVTGGVLMSVAAICVIASPHSNEELAALVLGLAVMAPGGFYLFFISRRVWDVICALRQHCDWAALRREALLVAMLFPCVAAIILGGVVLGATFGWPAVAATLFLAALNAAFLVWIRTPTEVGKRLLIEIEGFRLFLKSVERLPMQRTDEPSEHAGVYEKYLPYAVALEVEQAWGDRFVALTSTFHQNAGMPGAEAFYLGMWNGKPLEIIYKPEASRGRAIS